MRALEQRDHRLRVDARQRAGLSNRARLEEIAQECGRHQWTVDGQDDARLVGRRRAVLRRRRTPAARSSASVVDDLGTETRSRRSPSRRREPPRRPPAASAIPARRAISPRNLASAFGEPNRSEAPPTSSTPVAARRSATARCRRWHAHRAPSRRPSGRDPSRARPRATTARRPRPGSGSRRQPPSARARTRDVR